MVFGVDNYGMAPGWGEEPKRMTALARSRVDVIQRLTLEIKSGDFRHSSLENKLALIDAYSEMLGVDASR